MIKKKLFFATFILILWTSNIFGSALLIKEIHQDQFLDQTGNYNEPHPPFSSFKVALALIGFDANILQDENSPKWSFKEEYKKNSNVYSNSDYAEIAKKWMKDHTPKTFMRDSVVWFSQKITKILGMEKFSNYIKKLNYGNQDVSGTPGKNDGLLNSWLGTSLEVTPLQQLEFIEKLIAKQHPLSIEAQEKTIRIMKLEEKWGNWDVYGKTGSGDGKGWFIGWIQHQDRQIAFARYIECNEVDNNPKNFTGRIAKDMVKARLQELGFDVLN
ncbi:MAG: penicillin-binding transpeptidase domain-containing protein [Janthinobacterium lividum]